MRTKTVNVYTYSELSEKAKEYARMTYGQFDDVEFLTEEMKLQLHDAGFPDAKVNWSLAFCQGDGVCFMGEWYGRDDGMKEMVVQAYKGEVPKNVQRILPFVRLQLTKFEHYYCHAYTVSAEVDIVENYVGNIDRIEAIMEELEKDLNEYRIEMCEKLERFGYGYIEDCESEERFADDAEANEWEFYENGEMVV